MNDILIFKRYEKKYRINLKTKELLLSKISDRLYADEHGKSTVCSLYLDTPSHLLIRNSIIAKTYKEKLRLRCYGTPQESDPIFFEIKKKFRGVVYKRRVRIPLSSALDYIKGGEMPAQNQIMREIDYAMHIYGFPQPSFLIAYEREAYFGINDPNLRITFDSNIRFRRDNLRLENGSQGSEILGSNEIIMEIKTAGAVPLWLASLLSELEIFPSSFSKYGKAYLSTIQN